MAIPIISVILPVFNGEKYLRKSIKSVLSQSYTDYEFIIWNDGSADKSQDIIDSCYGSKIRVFNNITNQGLFKTINLAIKQARGEYIRLWSQDDIMKSYCLETEMEFYRSHPEIGMCYCARDVIDYSGKVVIEAIEDRTPEVVSPELATQIMFYFGSITGNISNVMIKKLVLDEIGLFREDMRVSGDFEMWVRLSERYPIGFIREPLIYLRSHSSQFSRQKGVSIVFMEEDKKVIHSLMNRLPPEIVAYAKIYNRWHRHVQYVHYMMHCFLTGDFKTATKTYREICQMDNPFLLIGLWMLTANGRLFKKKPKYAPSKLASQ